VVELAGLTDDDRAGTDDEDVVDVFTTWHECFLFLLGVVLLDTFCAERRRRLRPSSPAPTG
ncbi:MAG TPA: hypothetical protein H9907_02495, partial [Candidatus Corynebacterium intestinavium]|nr:hypothetical protein [Candidatus Corynebacterium intestinavium]